MKDWIKNYFKELFVKYSTPKEIETARDYRYVKKWVQKMCVLYAAFTALAVLEWILVLAFMPPAFIFRIIGYVLAPPFLLLLNWGGATLITYLPEVLKSVGKAGKTGYEVGEQFETTHIEVTHEYGNQYRVSSRTENKGCLFAIFGGMLQYLVWCFFCVYIGPFLTFKKIKKSIENLKQYEL